MPIPLAAVGLGMAGVGLARQLFGSGKESTDPSQYDYDPDRLALAEYRRLSDPSYGADRYDRLAAQASTGASALMRFSQSRGGSAAQGQEMAEASRAQSADQAFGAFTQFREGADRAALGALGMEQQRAQYQNGGVNDARTRNAERSASFTNQLLGGGLGLAGMALTSGQQGGQMMSPNAPRSAQPRSPSVMDMAATGAYGYTQSNYRAPMAPMNNWNQGNR